MSRLWLAASAFALLVGASFGCDNVAETCTTASCGTGSKTYQTCVGVNAVGITNTTYKYGGSSCDCTTSCSDCASKVATWCTQ